MYVYVMSQPAAPELKRSERTQRAFTSPSKAFVVGRNKLSSDYPITENADGETRELRQYAISHLALWDDVKFFGIDEEGNVMDSFTIHKLVVE